MVALAHNCFEYDLLRSVSWLFHHAGESLRGQGQADIGLEFRFGDWRR